VRLIPLLFVMVLWWASVASAQSPLQLNNNAVELLRDGRYAEGIELLKKATAAVPSDDSLSQNLVNAYLAAGGFFFSAANTPNLLS